MTRPQKDEGTAWRRHTDQGYLLHLWRDRATTPLRATLTPIGAPQLRRHFANLDDLLNFLITETRLSKPTDSKEELLPTSITSDYSQLTPPQGTVIARDRPSYGPRPTSTSSPTQNRQEKHPMLNVVVLEAHSKYKQDAYLRQAAHERLLRQLRPSIEVSGRRLVRLPALWPAWAWRSRPWAARPAPLG